MLTCKTTLVLGAGASHAFGFPLGVELRQQLLTLRHRRCIIDAGLLNDGGHQIEQFTAAFRDSQTISIDSFLGRRHEFEEIGKLAIAALLLSAENQDALVNNETPENWYQYLLNQLLAETWDELNFSNLSIVSFNYDRSFEHYLLITLGASYGKSADDVLAKLAELEITHVYGTLGPNLPGSPNYIPYGFKVAPDSVRAAASAIRVIPEGRNDDETLVKARASLMGAQRIGFLGFGFDRVNMERLNCAETCTQTIQRSDDRVVRTVVATCLEMSYAEAQQAADRLGWNTRYGAETLPTGFVNAHCLHMLRRTLLLG